MLLLLQVLEPIADSHLLRSQSDGPASYLPTSRQEVSADGHEAPKGRVSSGNGNAQPDGLQAIPNVQAASPELARALCQLHKDNERFDEIAQALDQEDFQGSLKSSSPRMHVGKSPYCRIYTYGPGATSSNSSEMRLPATCFHHVMLPYKLTVY